jgi:hypothetical protein
MLSQWHHIKDKWDWMRAMNWVGIIGGILVLFFILWLVVHNWGSPEINKALGSVLIGALIALLITLLTILRASEEQHKFVSSVVIDNRTHLPAVFEFKGHPLPDVTDPVEQRIAVRHAILGQLAKRGRVVASIKPDEHEDTIATEFFEYKPLYDFAESEGPESKDYLVGGYDDQDIKRILVKLRQRILPPRAVFIKSETLQKWLKGNRLLRSQVDMDSYFIRDLWIPKGARLSLSSQIVKTIPERVISIEVPGILDVSIRIQSLGSPGFGYLPPVVVADKMDLKHYRTYGIDVTMSARYKWLSAASPKMATYKQWVSFILARLEQLNSDTLFTEKAGNKVTQE